MRKEELKNTGNVNFPLENFLCFTVFLFYFYFFSKKENSIYRWRKKYKNIMQECI